MAISLAQSYFDITSISLDSSRYTPSFSEKLQEMEIGTSISIDERNFDSEQIPQNTQRSNSNYQGFEQAIDFVDSPPDSKEAWSADYVKDIHGPTTIHENHQIANPSSSAMQSRKRRMDWDSIEIQQQKSNNNNNLNVNVASPQAKSANLNSTTKERERKISRSGGIQGRLGWADDIELDLNEDLSNNGYISEALLAFNTQLTVLKQEIPSPTHDPQKFPRSPQDPQNNRLNNQSDSRQTSAGTVLQQQQQQQQTIQGQQQQNTANSHGSNFSNNNNNSNDAQNGIKSGAKPNNNGGRGIAEQNANVSSLQQMLQHQSSYEANSSPTICEVANYKKTEANSDDSRFQYVLAAPTSIATKNNEETLTYLNQGQSYEIKLKKLGDLSSYRGKVLKSVIRICFHERRLQYMEKEQIQQWLASRPGERIIEVDVPLSYGLCHVSQSMNVNLVNSVEVHWDPMKEVGVYIKVNCISTEFTPKKHGGEKGVPFRIQVETYFENNQSFETILKPIHAAACQIKVFKLKGADRKHKQDREKIQKRPPSEQEKYQPSCECTILTDISNDLLTNQNCYSPEHVRPTLSPLLPPSPVNMVAKFESIMTYNLASNPATTANLNISPNTNICKIIDQGILSPPQPIEMEEFIAPLTKESSPVQVGNWLNYHRLSQYISAFANFTGSDLLRMSKDDLVQICGTADGIRLFNVIRAKPITPRLTIYVSTDGNSYNAIYLQSMSIKELAQKFYKIPGLFESANNNNSGNNENGLFWGNGIQSKYSESGSNLYDASKLTLYIKGPSGIHVLINDEVLANIKDESLFTLDVCVSGKIVMKQVN